ncbi:MAG: hypothetical protein ACREQ5_00555 [Candidatus Dormibacteria bacterium]
MTFDDTTKALQAATVFRDAACVYTKIYIGLGADGTPDTTAIAIPVPAGTTTVTAAEMALIGLHTINDVLKFQITGGR